MPEQEYQMIAGVIATTIVFVIAGFFIVILVTYINQRKKKHRQEKETMQSNFQSELLQSQLEIQEQAFNNISQEIHDNVGQILSLAKVQISIMTESEDLNKLMLDEVKQNISKALTDLRDISRSLSGERLRSLSIHDSVAGEVERIGKTGFFSTRVNVLGQEIKVNDQKKLILFRVIQESLQNIIKHAEASLVTIEFNYLPELLQTTIQDNGKGFDPEEMIRKRIGLGLSNIRSRIALAGGTSTIVSEPGKGTLITINMHYE